MPISPTPKDQLTVYGATRRLDDLSEHDPVTRDAIKFNRHSINDGKHISPFDNARVDVGIDRIEVKLVQGIDEHAFKRTLSRATRATTGLTVGAVEDLEGWDEMLEGGLQAALETQTIVFEVSGVSRACTHQLVRSRKAGFHQQSQRATFYGNRPEIRIPESVWRNLRARDEFLKAVKAAHRAYQIACEEDISYQDARYILPEGTTNYILCEYTVREFLAVYSYRACSMFLHETVATVRQMGAILKEAYPWLARHIKISCEQTNGALDRDYDPDDPGTHHTCRFQGWESVEGCEFPWARETNRTFRSKHFNIVKEKT